MFRRAFTLIELIVVILIVVLIIGLLLPAVGGSHHHPRHLRDSNEIRSTIQAMTIWAQSNNGHYPLPSEIDTRNVTVSELGAAKDTTGNILSLLIFNGSASPEQFVSVAEVNSQIRRMAAYEYNLPRAANEPANALWDPAFRGTPEDAPTYASLPYAGIGHQSYAHAMPFGNRRAAWSDTFNATQAVFGNRGPMYAKDDAAPSSGKWTLTPDKFGTGSNTLLIHGGPKTWEGNIGYNDGHVNFETKPAPDAITLMIPGKKGKAAAADNLFVNETDEADGDGTTGRIDKGVNAYLRPIAEVQSSARPRFWRD